MSVERKKLRMGSGGYCVCPKCGKKLPHERGTPCMQVSCPDCGATMVREGSDHHKAFLRKKRG